MRDPLTELRRRVYRRSISKGLGVIGAEGLTSGFPPHYSGVCLPKIPINGTSALASIGPFEVKAGERRKLFSVERGKNEMMRDRCGVDEAVRYSHFRRSRPTRMVVSIKRSWLGIVSGFQMLAKLRHKRDRVADILTIRPHTGGRTDGRRLHPPPTTRLQMGISGSKVGSWVRASQSWPPYGIMAPRLPDVVAHAEHTAAGHQW
jgi:hypothetical protein